MKSKITPVIVLGIICLAVTLLLASVNMLTADRIAKVQYEKEQAALRDIMPKGEHFQTVEVTGLADSITAVYKESGGGYVFKISTKGYGAGLVILCGIDAKGNLTGVKSIVSNETPSKENGIGDKFNGMSLDNHSDIIVSGATKTSVAYSNAVKDSFEAYEMITQGIRRLSK